LAKVTSIEQASAAIRLMKPEVVTLNDKEVTVGFLTRDDFDQFSQVGAADMRRHHTRGVGQAAADAVLGLAGHHRAGELEGRAERFFYKRNALQPSRPGGGVQYRPIREQLIGFVARELGIGWERVEQAHYYQFALWMDCAQYESKVKQIADERARIASIPMADSKAVKGELRKLDDQAKQAERQFYSPLLDVKPPAPRRGQHPRRPAHG
jgi:hypothetical protein